MKPIYDFYTLLKDPRHIVITMHEKPDADAMGSSLGLKHFLIQLGHEVTVISPTNWTSMLNWMPGAKDVLDFEKNTDKSIEILKAADWLFCLDFNAFHRTRKMAPVLEELTCKKILIDHHQQPDEDSFDFGVSNTAKSSTAEMIYDFIVDSGNRDKLTKEVNECIYAGVVADTGSFRFSSTHAGVHKMVAELKDRGLDHTFIHESLFDNFHENRLRFIGNVLLNRLEVIYELNTAIVVIPKEDIEKYDIKTGDTEGLVNYPLSITGIKLAALVIDRDDLRKWSFRSKGDFDCNTFARNYFEGGGHFHAAGGRSTESLEDARTKFLASIKENKSSLI
jgi:bifunctional oligoribonuclease and PAP phosphatase NrnA